MLQPFALQKCSVQNLYLAPGNSTQGLDRSLLGALFDRRVPFWTNVKRRGRDLLLEFERISLLIRGGFTVHVNEPASKDDVVRLYLGHTADTSRPPQARAQRIAVRPNGKMRVTLLSPEMYAAIYRRFGSDVLSQAVDVPQLYDDSRELGKPIGAYLLDQNNVAGIGPRTAVEAIVVMAQCDLSTPVRELTPEQFGTCVFGAQLVAITALVQQVRKGEAYPYRLPAETETADRQ